MTEAEWNESSDPARMLEWVAQSDPNGYCKEPKYRASDRKLRLFACACCRLLPFDHRFYDVSRLRSVEQAERVADGEEAEIPWWWGSNNNAYDCAVSTAQQLPDLRDTIADLLRDIIGNPWRPHHEPFSGHLDLSGTRFEDSCQAHARLMAWNGGAILRMAEAIYEQRPGRKCQECAGRGTVFVCDPHDAFAAGSVKCNSCRATGRIEDGRLDNSRLAVLADALEDAEMPEIVKCQGCDGSGYAGGLHLGLPCPHCDSKGSVPNPILTHLRSEGVHVRGCWALDLLLGKS